MRSIALHRRLVVSDFRGNQAHQTIEQVVDSLNLGPKDRFNIQTILNELITNSLEHGLLSLESDLKTEAPGFATFYAKRAERIKQGREGQIDIHISHEFSDFGHKVHIRIADTGLGFDTSFLNASLPDNASPFGRGINITRELCSSLSYSRKGNEVHAIYELEQ